MNISNILKKLKDVVGVKSDKELASLLNVSYPTIAAWKKRNTLDFQKVIKFAVEHSIDLNYLFADAFIFNENSKDNKIQNTKNQEPNEFEEYVIFQLKKIEKLDRNSFFSLLNPKKEFLTRCLEQFKEIKEKREEMFMYDTEFLTVKNAKSVLISLIKKCKKSPILDSKTKEKNVILEVEENFSNIECYVLLKFPEYFV